MLDFPKTFFLKMTAALAAVVLLAGCFQDTGFSPNPVDPPARVESATMQVRMRVAAVNSLSKGATISLSRMIVVMTSNSATPTANDTIRDTLRTTGTTPTISASCTTNQTINKVYLIKGLRAWKVKVSVRDSRDSLIHLDSATTPYLGVADTALVTLGLASRYAMYDAKFTSLPDSISSTSGNIKQKLQINRLVLKVDGVIMRDSIVSPAFFASLVAHTLSYDYVGTANKVIVASGTSSHLNAVHFMSATNGVFVGANGVVRRTTNGGANWLTPSSTIGITKTLRSVYFANANNGWIVGDSITLRTTDAGVNWAPQTTPSPFNNTLRSVHFIDANTGWTVTSGVHKTTDGGVTWTPTFSIPTSFSIRFVTANTGWVVGNNSGGNIRKSTDGGATFSTQTSGTTKSLKSVFPVNDNLVYTVGDTGTILRTTNGGTNWVTRTSGTTQNLKSVYFLDAAVGYAVGDNGTILSTMDSGTTWTTQSSPSTANLTAIQFVGGKAFVTGENGTFFTLTGPRLIEMSAYGPMGTWNVANPLFMGSKYVDVAAGTDATVPLILNWVGPSTGGGSITATLSRVGKVSIIGKLPGTP